nr:Chain A, SGMGCIT segment 58-64 from Keratin-8 with G62C mutation [Homo sapiens]
SGMGCIT